MFMLSPVIVDLPSTGPIPFAIAVAICGFTIFIGVTLGVALFDPNQNDRDDARRILTSLLRAVAAGLRAISRRQR